MKVSDHPESTPKQPAEPKPAPQPHVPKAPDSRVELHSQKPGASSAAQRPNEE